jgi:hypothetical protein
MHAEYMAWHAGGPPTLYPILLRCLLCGLFNQFRAHHPQCADTARCFTGPRFVMGRRVNRVSWGAALAVATAACCFLGAAQVRIVVDTS